MKHHWLSIVLLASLCLIGVPQLAISQSESQESVPYDLPVVKYNDMEFDLAYLIYYENRNLQEVPQIQDAEEKKKIVLNAIKNMIFEHQLANQIKETDFTSNVEYQAHNRLIEAQNLFKHYYQNEFRNSYQPNMEELQKRYEANKEDYFVTPKFSFRHIFFKTIEEPQEVKQEALQRAQKALALIESGSTFVQVADLMSDSETKSKVVGPFVPREFNQDPINPILEDVLLELKPSQHSEIIETRYGYQILLLESYQPERYKNFSEVSSTLEREYQQEQRNLWLSKLVEDNWDDAIAQYNLEVIFDDNADDTQPIFEVYGKPYTKAEWNEIYSSILSRYSNLPEAEQREKVDTYVKDNIIRHLIAAKFARDKGYESIPNYYYMTETYRNSVLARIQLEKLTETHLAEHPVTDNEIKDFYDENNTLFQLPAEYKVGMMTFMIPEPEADTKYEQWKAQQTAMEKAQQAIERLKNGDSFEDIAKEMSEDQFAEQGGKVGLVHNQMEDNFLRGIARDMQTVKAGTFTTTPKKKNESYVIYYNYGKADPDFKPFDSEEVQDRIKTTLTNRRTAEFKRTLVDQHVNDDDIEVLNEVVYEMPLDRISRIPTDVSIEEEE